MENTSCICLKGAFLKEKHGTEMVVSHDHKAFSDRATKMLPQGLALMLHATPGSCGQLLQGHETLWSDGILENKRHHRV